jgi:hypothetical protein
MITEDLKQMTGNSTINEKESTWKWAVLFTSSDDAMTSSGGVVNPLIDKVKFPCSVAELLIEYTPRIYCSSPYIVNSMDAFLGPDWKPLP